MADGLAIGIDLGTTYSCAAVFLNKAVTIISNDQGNRTTPSTVAFTEHNELLIGEAALNQISRNPNNSVFDAKRLIGRNFSDECVQSDKKLWPFDVVAGAKDKPMIKVNFKSEDKLFSPEQISSMVLFKMKEAAEKLIGATVKNAVITVPARFNDSQRKATKDAGTIAGLNVLRIINEPTAAALAYGFNTGKGTRNVLIFDAGGGTCDVSILRIKKNVFEVKATAGDTHLGGQDIDNRLVDHFVEEIKTKHKRDISGNLKALCMLKKECENAKRVLSSCTHTNIIIDSLDKDFHFSAMLSRAKFEAVVMDLLEKFVEPVESCLNDANLRKSDVDDIVLVGGSTRIPKLQSMIKEMFKGKDLCNSVHPDEAVAYGAAVQAAILSGSKDVTGKDVKLVDATPLSLGVHTVNDVMSVIIPRNTSIPRKMERTYTTTVDDQWGMDIDIYEGERARASDNNLLGKFTFDGIPAALRGVGKVKVCFDVDADGILNVSAKEKTTGKKMCITVDNDEGHLLKEEVDRMLVEARKHKEDDDNFRKAMEAKSSLDLCVYRLNKKINDLAIRSKFDAANLNDMEDAINRASQCLEGTQLTEHGYREIEKKLQIQCGRLM